jgi:hypothetical protein
MAGNTEEAGKTLDALEANLKGMLLRNPLLRTATNIMNAKAPNLKKTNEAFYNSWMNEMVNKYHMSVDAANRVLDTFEFVLPGSAKAYLEAAGVKDKSGKLAGIVGAGVGVRPLNIAEDLTNYLGGKAASDITAARTSYMKLLKMDFPVSDEQVDEAFKTALEKAGEPYTKLQEAVYAARAQDVSDLEIMQRLKASGISKRMITTILSGQPLTPIMMMGDLKKDMQKDLLHAYTDETKRQEAQDRYIKNEQRLINLIQKYQENE